MASIAGRLQDCSKAAVKAAPGRRQGCLPWASRAQAAAPACGALPSVCSAGPRRACGAANGGERVCRPPPRSRRDRDPQCQRDFIGGIRGVGGFDFTHGGCSAQTGQAVCCRHRETQGCQLGPPRAAMDEISALRRPTWGEGELRPSRTDGAARRAIPAQRPAPFFSAASGPPPGASGRHPSCPATATVLGPRSACCDVNRGGVRAPAAALATAGHRVRWSASRPRAGS